jgi:hypothetical protein
MQNDSRVAKLLRLFTKSGSDGVEANRMGLQLLHEPQTRTGPNTIDVIFVHGLGGSAKGTWTHPETNGFWPTWLLEKEGFKNVRIATFGYNADYQNIFSPRNDLDIDDFSKQLLEAMFLDYHKHGDVVSVDGCS